MILGKVVGLPKGVAILEGPPELIRTRAEKVGSWKCLVSVTSN